MSQKPAARPPAFVDAADASALLGIRRASLYAYVSRGAIRVARHPTDPRARVYAFADIKGLLDRKARGRRPAAAAATALDWGLPVLETRISRIADGRLAYRGTDAIALSETGTLEEVACLLWDCGARNPFSRRALRKTAGAAANGGSAIDRAIYRLAGTLSVHAEQSPDGAAAIVRECAAAMAGGSLPAGPVHEALARAWRRPGAADIIRRALVLSADHELNTSTFAARVVASTGASLTACVIAGLAALGGPRHGGAVERVAAFFDACSRARDPAASVRARLARGKPAAGFGHVLYPDGDPRAGALLAACPPQAPLAAILAAGCETTGLRPSIDAALVVVERTELLPRGAALAIFALGRTVGWLAHAMEQHGSGQLIRPRAAYVGTE